EPEQQRETFLDFDAQQSRLRVAFHRLLEERHSQRVKPSGAELHDPQSHFVVEHIVELSVDCFLDLAARAAVELRESTRRSARNTGLDDALISIIIAVHEAVLSGAPTPSLYHREAAQR